MFDAPTPQAPGDPGGATYVVPPGYGETGEERGPTEYGEPAFGYPLRRDAASVYAPQPRRRRRHRVRYEEGMEIPEGGEIVELRRLVLTIGGAAAFGASWGFSSFIAIDEGRPVGVIPVLGPILFQIEDGRDDLLPLMIFLSAAQTAGLVLFGVGVRKRRYIEYWSRSRRPAEAGRRWALSPSVNRDGAALHLTVW